jgi:predicted permease
MNWVKQLFSRRRLYNDLSEEIQEHLDEKIEELVAGGISRKEATAVARREFGNLTLTEERGREVWQWPSIENLFMDVRYGLRILRKNPGFTAVAVLTLALSIGANTAIFSLLYSLTLRNLPVPHPEQLVRFGAHAQDDPYTALSVPMFEEFARGQKLFSGVFAWDGDGVLNIEINGAMSRADIWAVTENYYSGLAAVPEIGRLIGPEDADLRATAPTQVAVLGYSFWQRRYGGDRSVIGKTLKIEDFPFTIIGVTRKGFGGISAEDVPEVTVPLTASPLIYHGDADVQKHLQRRDALWIEAAGRLKPGDTLDEARAQLESQWPGIREAMIPAKQSAAERANFLSLQLKVESGARGASFLRKQFTQPLYLLLAIAGVVLLLACVNLASLMLARAAARSHEMGVRISLGASRTRLAQQVLTESLVLSVAGTLAGFGFAQWGSRALSNLITGEIYIVPAALNLTPDARILGFTSAAAILTAVLFGLAPAWRATCEDRNSALQKSSRTAGQGTGGLGKGLIVTQVALSFVLVAAAGLFLRSLEKLRAIDPGFQTRGVLNFGLTAKPGGYKNLDFVSYYRQLVERVSSLPGVTSAGMIHLRLGGVFEWTEKVRGIESNTEEIRTDFSMVMPGAFRTLGMEVFRGRDFGWQDDDHAPRVAVVSQSLAAQLFPNEGVLGQHINVTTQPKWQNIEIVGIVTDASLYDIRKHAPPTLYVPATQYGDYMGWSEMLVQTKIAPGAMAEAVRHAIESMGHEYVTGVRTVSQEINRSLLQQRIIAMLSGFFGALALLLAAIGLYGLMAYNVTRRTREIGIRMALGAEKRDVRWMVLRETLLLTAFGLAVGLPCALGASRLIASMLYGIGPSDPVTLAVVSVALAAVSAMAGWLPARRAIRVDPMVALRYE